MNLFKIGATTINMDRVDGIQERPASTDPASSEGETAIRILFDSHHLDLTGSEAQVLRRWVRHHARNLAPRKSEDGEELVSPEEQVQKTLEALIHLIDRARPRDSAVRSTAHRLEDMIEEYITGQLQPTPAPAFERVLAATRAEAQSAQESSP